MYRAGHSYHVYNRGCNQENIFATQDNYLFLLRRAKSTLENAPVRILAYCLMPNHYHFLLQGKEDQAIPRFIQRLFNSYTQAYNRQQDRSGTLFQGRAKHILVDKDEYLLHLARYIHLNPVRAGIVQRPGDWPYLNYLEWVDKRDGSLVDREFVRSYFPEPAMYEDFVLGEISAAYEQKLKGHYLD